MGRRVKFYHNSTRNSEFGNETDKHDGVSKSFRTGHLAQELKMVQLSATMCSCIAIL